MSAAAPDPAVVRALAAELHLPELVCRLLVQRGFGDPDRAKRYLRPRLDHLHDPARMRGMDVAVDRLSRAIDAGETILVHGDYDVDGMCSSTILLRTLRALGGRAVPFIPRRLEDGYDLTMAGVRAAVDARAAVLVTCDCGTNAVEPVAQARAAGIDVILSDHHLPSGPMPGALAMLNPRQPGCEYPDKDLAAVGVAFKLALALVHARSGRDDVVYRMLDLVALATVADVAPLRGENRILVRTGLRVMRDSPSVGVRALVRAAGLEGRAITTGRVGFVLAPRLNAVGRLAHALVGVELLLADDEGRANAIARDLESLNQQRQEIDRATLRAALEKVEHLDLDATYGLVLAEEGWHPGVVGIVASRLVEHLCRPVVLVALNGRVGKGSGRSIPAFDLHGALVECREHLERFGGHRAAAGVTIDADKLDAFRARFDEVARERLTPDDLVPELHVDLEVRLNEITDDLEALLRHFEPFGVANPAPVLAARGVTITGQPRVVGQGGHLKFVVTADDARLELIGFGQGELAADLAPGARVDVAFRLERDVWNGDARLVGRLADLHR